MKYWGVIFVCLMLILTGCGKGAPVKTAPFSVGLKQYQGQYLQFSYPSSAKLQLVSNKESFLLGPQIVPVQSADATSNVHQGESKYAYQIHIIVHDNPMKLAADVWAKDFITREWKHTQGGPDIYPITQDGHIMEDFVSYVQVGDEKAFMVDVFGFDYNTRSLYFSKDNIVIEMIFTLYPLETDPTAVLQKDIYALILGSLRFVD